MEVLIYLPARIIHTCSSKIARAIIRPWLCFTHQVKVTPSITIEQISQITHKRTTYYCRCSQCLRKIKQNTNRLRRNSI